MSERSASVESEAVPEGVHAVVDSYLNGLGSHLSRMLNNQATVPHDVREWVHKQLYAVARVTYHCEQLTSFLMAYALNSGISKDDVSWAMDRPTDELGIFATVSSQRLLQGALGEDPKDHDVESVEDLFVARSVAEHRSEHRRLADELMELLLLHRTPRHAARGLYWASDKTRTAIQNGWYIQAKRGPGRKSDDDASGAMETASPPHQVARSSVTPQKLA
ncbi:hypothetical protein [Streptomyces ochraceiscleroticus]|uniref:Uncharacterized protein n=1 Tax=Streptomyces ochraceiscleroticus TaxID=47761 RepID=A0ABW1MVA1_9ACTN|nr:hypothetical protein [Streptomyces ochraceiscleroticus]